MTNKWSITLTQTEWDNPHVVHGGEYYLGQVPEDRILEHIEALLPIIKGWRSVAEDG